MSDAKRPDDDGPGAIRAEFDWSTVPPSTAVVETVAIAADRDPVALEPLYDAIDPDALDALIHSRGARSTDGDATVTFGIDGYQVTIQRAGTVVVRPDAGRPEPE